jgi:hypothetical protein
MLQQGLCSACRDSAYRSLATLSGKLNPNGTDTHYYFQYGKTAGYGSVTVLEDGGFGTTTVSESATIAGLEADMTYHYRFVASSSAGTSYGYDRVFRTAAWSAAVAESGGEAIGLCVGGTSTPIGCSRAPGAEASASSPSVTSLSDGSAAVSFVGAGNHFDECHVTYVGGSSCWETSTLVAAGTNPSIAWIPGGQVE